MTWRHIERTTTTAERNLTRANNKTTFKKNPWTGVVEPVPPPEPSVGGTTTKTHDTWKCGACGAWACTAAGRDGEQQPPGKCGKCKP